MEEQLSFTLIDGTFDPAIASPLISSLYQSKILYHSQENLRQFEYFGKNSLIEEQRILVLENARKQFNLKMTEAMNLDLDVLIKSNIEVTFINKESKA
ncbi:hypothetical protein BH09BAC6_BH09BAC6_16890 [soil metagenome]